MKNKKRNAKYTKVFKRFISTLVSGAVLLTSINLSPLVNEMRDWSITAWAEDYEVPSGEAIKITGVEELKTFINSGYNKNAIILLSNIDTYDLDNSFSGIGTASEPFQGQVKINVIAGQTASWNAAAPLFNVVCDSVSIINSLSSTSL